MRPSWRCGGPKYPIHEAVKGASFGAQEVLAVISLPHDQKDIRRDCVGVIEIDPRFGRIFNSGTALRTVPVPETLSVSPQHP